MAGLKLTSLASEAVHRRKPFKAAVTEDITLFEDRVASSDLVACASRRTPPPPANTFNAGEALAERAKEIIAERDATGNSLDAALFAAGDEPPPPTTTTDPASSSSFLKIGAPRAAAAEAYPLFERKERRIPEEKRLALMRITLGATAVVVVAVLMALLRGC